MISALSSFAVKGSSFIEGNIDVVDVYRILSNTCLQAISSVTPLVAKPLIHRLFTCIVSQSGSFNLLHKSAIALALGAISVLKVNDNSTLNKISRVAFLTLWTSAMIDLIFINPAWFNGIDLPDNPCPISNDPYGQGFCFKNFIGLQLDELFEQNQGDFCDIFPFPLLIDFKPECLEGLEEEERRREYHAMLEYYDSNDAKLWFGLNYYTYGVRASLHKMDQIEEHECYRVRDL